MDRQEMEKKLIEIKELDLKRHYKCDMNEDYVFISYSSKDKLLVWNVFKSLMDDGFNVFIDKANLTSTQEYDRQLLDAASNPHCKYCMFFNSEESLKSTEVMKEMEKARIKNVMNIFVFNQTGLFRQHYHEVLKQKGGDDLYTFTRICELTGTIDKANGLVLQEREDYREFIDYLEFELEDTIGLKKRTKNSIVMLNDSDDNIDKISKPHNAENKTGESDQETHNLKVKNCVLKEIEKYKNEGKLVTVGNSKSIFTTKVLNDLVKCNEFDNNKTSPGHLIGYYIGFYGLNRYSWSTFTFNLGVENIDNKGIVKDRINSLIEARNKMDKDGLLEKLLKEAVEKGLQVKVNYNNTFGKTSTNLLTVRFDDKSDDENTLIKNIDNAMDWIIKFENNLLNI